MAGRKIRLSVRAKDGRLEIFPNVSSWTFSHFYDEVRRRFGIRGAIALMFGESELPNNDLKIGTSDIGLVSGDRLRLVAVDQDSKVGADFKSVLTSSLSTVPTTETSSSSSASSKSTSKSLTAEEMDSSTVSGSFIDSLLEKMLHEGFECIERSEGDNRMKFKHPSSSLVVEVALQLYEDARSKCAHVTASLIYPTRRIFLDPIILRDDFKENLNQFVGEIRKAVLGPRNGLLRLLQMNTIGVRILSNLETKELLRLEMTCKDALQACRGEAMEALWKNLLSKDFGVSAGTAESSREAYKRCYLERQRRLREEGFYDLIHVGQTIVLPQARQRSPPANPFPDPDMPQGPFQPRNPFAPPIYPFPGSSQPRGPLNPFDPTQGEIMPSRPRHPDGIPRRFPRGGFGGGEDFI